MPGSFSQKRTTAQRHEVREARERIAAALRLLTNALVDGSEFSAVEAMEAAVVLLAQADTWLERAG